MFLFPLGTTGVNQTGFSQSTSFVPTLNSYLTPYSTLSNPFPDGIQQPTGSSLGLATYLGKDITFYNPHPLNPYSMRWDLGIQHELRHDMVFEVAYVGTRGRNLFRQVGINQARLASPSSPITNAVTGAVITTNTPANAALRAPFQGVGNRQNLDADARACRFLRVRGA